MCFGSSCVIAMKSNGYWRSLSYQEAGPDGPVIGWKKRSGAEQMRANLDVARMPNPHRSRSAACTRVLASSYALAIRAAEKQKVLDRISGPTLYKTDCANDKLRVEENNSMLMSWAYKEHSTKWQPSAAIYTVVCSLGLILSATDYFGGSLGQETPINRRHIKQ